MRVQSSLADIDFVIGEMRREGDNLILTSDPSSSLEATVRMKPSDAARMLKAFFKSPTAIGYALSLPFLWLGGKSETKSAAAAPKHPFDELNRPW
ncbi:MAG: hypothetical protein KDA48_15715 [Amphiplicatus sp.]|nr:hypothetical protein [Amphiplicatus sp.]